MVIRENQTNNNNDYKKNMKLVIQTVVTNIKAEISVTPDSNKLNKLTALKTNRNSSHLSPTPFICLLFMVLGLILKC